MTDLMEARKIAREALRIAHQRNVRLSFGPGQHVMTPGHFMEGAIEEAITAALPMLVRAERAACEDIAFDHTCDAGPPELCLCSHRIATAIRSRGEP